LDWYENMCSNGDKKGLKGERKEIWDEKWDEKWG
jgi:hypothetical protein